MGKARIVRPAPANIRDAWPGEATDFTPWLANNLDALDFLEPGPLNLVDIEVSLPDTGRNLDVLAETSDGRRVAIENQYGRADHDHLTRGLAYAVGLDAAALIIIAEEHRPEFVAVADYLNTAYEQMPEEDGIALFLVTVSVEQVADMYLPRFTTVSSPNQWRARVTAAKRATIESIEAFLEGSDPDLQDAYAALIRAWEAQPSRSLRRNGRTVGLTFQFDGPPRKTRSMFTLEMDGGVWANRDFCRQISGMDDEALDALLASIAPEFEVVGSSGAWWRAVRPAPSALEQFADRITDGAPEEAPH